MGLNFAGIKFCEFLIFASNVVSVVCTIAPLSSKISQGKRPTILPLDLDVLIASMKNAFPNL